MRTKYSVIYFNRVSNEDINFIFYNFNIEPLNERNKVLKNFVFSLMPGSNDNECVYIIQ